MPNKKLPNAAMNNHDYKVLCQLRDKTFEKLSIINYKILKLEQKLQNGDKQ